MRITRAVVVYKKSAYQLHVVERRDAHLRRLLRRGHPDLREMRIAHAVHEETLARVIDTLQSLKIRSRFVYRARLGTIAPDELVIAVGGDGTLLQAAHAVQQQLLLGVNADERRSEAVFCAATKETVVQVVRQVWAGRVPIRRLSRLRLSLNGRPQRPLIVNDVLLAHPDPATMSRYRLRIGPRREAQKSSGLWVATAAGSSSAILAAGGIPLSWTTRRFQYRPRELYQGRLSRNQLRGGVLAPHARVEVTWLMREGAAFIDGPHVRYPLQFGDHLTIALSKTEPLQIVDPRGAWGRS